MKLSIVTTLYRSEQYINEFCSKVHFAARQIPCTDYEVILVDDGSPDNSLNYALQLQINDSRLVVVELSRNFGHHKAILTGLSFASGDLIFLIDSDLEEDPLWLPDFYSLMKSSRSDVVYGVQVERKGSFFERMSGRIYYKLFAFLTGFNQPKNLVTARLMSRAYVSSLLKFNESEFVISCLFALTGFRQQPFPVCKQSSSPTTYSFFLKVSNAITSVVSVSTVPLQLIFYVGIIILLISFCFIFWALFSALFLGAVVSGWTSVFVSLWFFGGLMILFLGIIGIYISKVFWESKRRPISIVKSIHCSE